LLEVNITHVHSEAACLRELLVLDHYLVGPKGFLVKAVGVLHVGMVVEDIES
jgi:hypothetical protein